MNPKIRSRQLAKCFSTFPEMFKTAALLGSCLSVGIGLAAHGAAYLKAQEAKVRSQVVIENRLISVEQKASHAEHILERLDIDYVPRSEIMEREKREDERDHRIERIERTVDDINRALTRLATSQLAANNRAQITR